MLVQPNDRIFVKGYGFSSFVKNMGKNIGENISKNLSRKYSQNLLDHAKQSTTDVFKICFQKSNLKKQQKQLVIWLGNKIATKITAVSKIWQQNNSETIRNNHDKEKRS